MNKWLNFIEIINNGIIYSNVNNRLFLFISKTYKVINRY